MAAGGEDKNWIAAQTALALLTGGGGVADDQAKETLIQGAASGLVATRCRRLRWEPLSANSGGGHQKDNADIPPPFWVEFLTRPENRKAENWAFGNFSVYSTDRWQSPGYMHTLGVEFAEPEVRSLVPQGVAEPSPSDSSGTGAERASGEMADEAPNRDAPDLTVEEYERWFTPTEVLDALPSNWSIDTKIRLIAQSLEDGELRAVADKVVAERQKADRFDLPRQMWRGWACLADPDFWNTGLRTVYGDQREWDGPGFTAYRIRLDPIGAARLAPGQMTLPSRAGAAAPQRREPREPAPPKRDKPTKAELLEWARQFGAANPGASFRMFLTNARLHWPTLHVSEMPMKHAIAELELNITPGNPRITRKNRRVSSRD